MVETIKAWMNQRDFKSLYEMIHDSDELSHDDKEELLPYILEIAHEIIHEHIIDGIKVNFEVDSEHFMLRFLYENAMYSYESGELHDAKENFSLLSVFSNSKHFEKSLKRHILALIKGVDFNTFVVEWVDTDPLKHFYISTFTKEVEKMFKENSSTVDEAVVQYKKLFK